jgi:hypothetical protein
VVWEGSHRLIRAAFAEAFAGVPADWPGIDVTEIYQQVRREVFATCPRVEVPLAPRTGGAGPSPRDPRGRALGQGGEAAPEGRAIVYFGRKRRRWRIG